MEANRFDGLALVGFGFDLVDIKPIQCQKKLLVELGTGRLRDLHHEIFWADEDHKLSGGGTAVPGQVYLGRKSFQGHPYPGPKVRGTAV